MTLKNGTYKITNHGYSALLKPNASGVGSGLVIATDDQSDVFKVSCFRPCPCSLADSCTSFASCYQWILKASGNAYTLQNLDTKLFVSTDANSTTTSTVTVQSTSFNFVIDSVAGSSGVYTYALSQCSPMSFSSVHYSIATEDTGMFLGAANALNGARVSHPICA